MDTAWTTVPAGGDIQAAIDTLYTAAGGGVMILGAGTWTLTDPLTLKGNLTIRGMGRFISVLQFNGCTGFTFTGPESLGGDLHDYFTLQDYGILGDFTADTIGIDIKLDLRSVYERLAVQRFGSHGIRLDSCFSSVIRSCVIRDNDGDGIYLGPIVTATTIADNEIQRNNGAGVTACGVSGSLCGMITITGGAIENNNRCGVDMQNYVGAVHMAGVGIESNNRSSADCADHAVHGRPTPPAVPVVAYSVMISSAGAVLPSRWTSRAARRCRGSARVARDTASTSTMSRHAPPRRQPPR